MRTFLWGLLIINQLIILIVGSADLKKYQLTDFQLKAKLGGKIDKKSQLLRKLHKNLPYVIMLQRVAIVVVFAISVTLFTNLFNPILVGLSWALFSIFILTILQRLKVVKKYSYQLFEYMLELIISISNLFKPVWWLFGVEEKTNFIVPSSEAELKDLIGKTTAISVEERERLGLILEANEKTAKEIMTRSHKVTHVAQSSTLGPILLAELEKSGHHYFPVFTKNEEVVGILNLRAVSDVGTAKTFGKVSDIMEEDLVWVPDDMPVFEVARMFLTAKQYVLLVQNEKLEFAGIITVADLIVNTIGIRH